MTIESGMIAPAGVVVTDVRKNVLVRMDCS